MKGAIVILKQPVDGAALGKEHSRLSQRLFPYLLRCRNRYVTIHTNRRLTTTIYPAKPLFQASRVVDLNLNEEGDSEMRSVVQHQCALSPATFVVAPEQSCWPWWSSPVSTYQFLGPHCPREAKLPALIFFLISFLTFQTTEKQI